MSRPQDANPIDPSLASVLDARPTVTSSVADSSALGIELSLHIQLPAAWVEAPIVLERATASGLAGTEDGEDGTKEVGRGLSVSQL